MEPPAPDRPDTADKLLEGIRIASDCFGKEDCEPIIRLVQVEVPSYLRAALPPSPTDAAAVTSVSKFILALFKDIDTRTFPLSHIAHLVELALRYGVLLGRHPGHAAASAFTSILGAVLRELTRLDPHMEPLFVADLSDALASAAAWASVLATSRQPGASFKFAHRTVAAMARDWGASLPDAASPPLDLEPLTFHVRDAAGASLYAASLSAALRAAFMGRPRLCYVSHVFAASFDSLCRAAAVSFRAAAATAVVAPAAAPAGGPFADHSLSVAADIAPTLVAALRHRTIRAVAVAAPSALPMLAAAAAFLRALWRMPPSSAGSALEDAVADTVLLAAGEPGPGPGPDPAVAAALRATVPPDHILALLRAPAVVASSRATHITRLLAVFARCGVLRPTLASATCTALSGLSTLGTGHLPPPSHPLALGPSVVSSMLGRALADAPGAIRDAAELAVALRDEDASPDAPVGPDAAGAAAGSTAVPPAHEAAAFAVASRVVRPTLRRRASRDVENTQDSDAIESAPSTATAGTQRRASAPSQHDNAGVADPFSTLHALLDQSQLGGAAAAEGGGAAPFVSSASHSRGSASASSGPLPGLAYPVVHRIVASAAKASPGEGAARSLAALLVLRAADRASSPPTRVVAAATLLRALAVAVVHGSALGRSWNTIASACLEATADATAAENRVARALDLDPAGGVAGQRHRDELSATAAQRVVRGVPAAAGAWIADAAACHAARCRASMVAPPVVLRRWARAATALLASVPAHEVAAPAARDNVATTDVLLPSDELGSAFSGHVATLRTLYLLNLRSPDATSGRATPQQRIQQRALEPSLDRGWGHAALLEARFLPQPGAAQPRPRVRVLGQARPALPPEHAPPRHGTAVCRDLSAMEEEEDGEGGAGEGQSLEVDEAQGAGGGAAVRGTRNRREVQPGGRAMEEEDENEDEAEDKAEPRQRRRRQRPGPGRHAALPASPLRGDGGFQAQIQRTPLPRQLPHHRRRAQPPRGAGQEGSDGADSEVAGGAAEDEEEVDEVEDVDALGADNASALGIFFADTRERMRARKRRRRVSQYASPSLQSPQLSVLNHDSPTGRTARGRASARGSSERLPGAGGDARPAAVAANAAEAIRALAMHAASAAAALVEMGGAPSLSAAAAALCSSLQASAVAWRYLLVELGSSNASSARAAILLDACLAPAAAMETVVTAAALLADDAPRAANRALATVLDAAMCSPVPELSAAALAGGSVATWALDDGGGPTAAAGSGSAPAAVALPAIALPFAMAWADAVGAENVRGCKLARRAVRLRMQHAVAALSSVAAAPARHHILQACERFARGILQCAPAVAATACLARGAADVLGAAIALAALHETCSAPARTAVESCLRALHEPGAARRVGSSAGPRALPFVFAARALAWVQCSPHPATKIGDCVLLPALFHVRAVASRGEQAPVWAWQDPPAGPIPAWLAAAVRAAKSTVVVAAARRVGRVPREAVLEVARATASEREDVIRRLAVPSHGDAQQQRGMPDDILLAVAARHARALSRSAVDEASRAANGLALLGALLSGALASWRATVAAAAQGAAVPSQTAELSAELVALASFSAALRDTSRKAALASDALAVRGARGGRTRAAAAAVVAPCARTQGPQAPSAIDSCVPSLALGSDSLPPVRVDATSAHAVGILLRCWSCSIFAAAPVVGAAPNGTMSGREVDAHEDELFATRVCAWDARACAADFGATLPRCFHVWRSPLLQALHEPLTDVAAVHVAHNLAREALHLSSFSSEVLMWATQQELLPELLRRRQRGRIVNLITSLAAMLQLQRAGAAAAYGSVPGERAPPAACVDAMRKASGAEPLSTSHRRMIRRTLVSLSANLLVRVRASLPPTVRRHQARRSRPSTAEAAEDMLEGLLGEDIAAIVTDKIQPLLRVLTWELAGVHADAAHVYLRRLATVITSNRRTRGADAPASASRKRSRRSLPSAPSAPAAPLLRDGGPQAAAAAAALPQTPSAAAAAAASDSDVRSVLTFTSAVSPASTRARTHGAHRRFRLSRTGSGSVASGDGGDGGGGGSGGGGSTGSTLGDGSGGGGPIALVEDEGPAPELERLLVKHFLFLMNVLGRTVRPQVPALHQRRALGALEVLLRSLRANALHAFVPAITSVLKHAVNNPMLRLAACRAWHTFVLRIGEDDLRAVLSTVVVALAGVVMELSTERPASSPNCRVPPGNSGARVASPFRDAARGTGWAAAAAAAAISTTPAVAGRAAAAATAAAASAATTSPGGSAPIPPLPAGHAPTPPSTVYEVSSDVEEDDEVGEATDEADEMAAVAASILLDRALASARDKRDGSGTLVRLASCVLASPVVAGQSASGSALGFARSTLSFLLHSRRAQLREAIVQLPMLPAHESLREVTDVLKEEIEPIGLEDRLHNLRRLLRHDALGVQRAALRALRNLLRDRTCSVLDAALRSDGAAGGRGGVGGARPVAEALTGALLAYACRASDRASRVLCAECLGELGAVDPARMVADTRRTSEPLHTGNAFAVRLLELHLVRELRASPESAVQDRVALAVQQTLRFLTSSADDKRALDVDDLRLALGDDIFNTVEPYLRTSYEPNAQPAGGGDGQPIYATSSSFEDWVAAWCKRLIDRATGPLASIFRSCRAMLPSSPTTATYLLPSLVVDVLSTGTPEAAAAVAAEIQAVLRDERIGFAAATATATAGTAAATAAAAAGPPQHPQAPDAIGTAAFRSFSGAGGAEGEGDHDPFATLQSSPSPPTLPASALTQGETALGAGGALSSRRAVPAPGGMRVRAAQAVFGLLDRLQTFVESARQQARRARRNSASRSGSGGGGGGGGSGAARDAWLEKDSEILAEAERVHKVLDHLSDSIPKRELASAAFRCRAHTRSLLWLELHLREALSASSRRPADVDFALEPAVPREALAFMQQIYAALDEPDGLEGIAHLRARLAPDQRGVTLRERIVDHEHAARWADAMLCYEQAIQMAEDAPGSAVPGPPASAAVRYQPGGGGGGPGSAHAAAAAPLRAGADARGLVRELELPEAEEGSEPLVVQLHSGLLRCMLRAGHLDMLLRQVEASVRRAPEMAPHVVPYAVNACWQLGRWDDLDALLHEGARLGLRGAMRALLSRPPLSGAPTLLRRGSSSLALTLRDVADALADARAQPDTPALRLQPAPSPLAGLHVAPAGAVGRAGGAPPGSAPASGAGAGAASWPSTSAAAAAAAASSSKPLQVYNLTLGASVAAFARGDAAAFKRGLDLARLTVMEPLSAAAMDSHSRAYPWVVKLHVLRELEQAFDAREAAAATAAAAAAAAAPGSAGSQPAGAVRSFLHTRGWPQRLQLLTPTERSMEPVLTMRRVVYRHFGMHREEGATWLQSASMARTARHPESANGALLHARRLGDAGVDVEAARLLWESGKRHEALQLLEPAELDMVQVVRENEGQRAEVRAALAERLHVATEWLRELGQRPAREIVERYAAIVKLRRDWEKGYFSLGAFYDSLLVRLTDEGREEEPCGDRGARREGRTSRRPGRGREAGRGSGHARAAGQPRRDYLVPAMRNFGRALEHGCEHLYEALPRLLTLWFKHCEELDAERARPASLGHCSGERPEELTARIEALCGEVETLVDRVPAYKWLTALSQLVSRIAHPCPEVWATLRLVLCRILAEHPMQALWTVMGLVHAKAGEPRQVRMLEVVKQVQTAREALKDVFQGTNRMYRLLIKLAKFKCKEKVVNTQFRRHMDKFLPQLRLVMPLQSQLTVVLPNAARSGLAGGGFGGGVGGGGGGGGAGGGGIVGPGGGLAGPPRRRSQQFSPFPDSQVLIRHIESEAQVMQSKETPKRITVVGSDGRPVNFLVKAEQRGDLRKDARMMEFGTLVNRLLAQDAEGRRRKLSLRTYAVICLCEDCGMLEWVPSTSALRSLIAQQYHRRLKELPETLLKRVQAAYLQMQQLEPRPGRAATVFRDTILPAFPALFHLWFRHAFPEPTAWYAARQEFTRTAAVWAMVGHVVGLGDRHGENILLDTTTGECVHVDYDCIFDKGLSLSCPEVVPFRLTHNMVDAMGPMGHHGVFTCVSRVAMGVLREHRTMIMSSLESFVHDPLVEWSRTGGQRGNDQTEANTQALRSIGRIEDRLRGMYNQGPGGVPPSHGKYRVYRAQAERGGGRGLVRQSSDAAEETLVVDVQGRANALPLSLSGQVKTLIEEATKLENLAQMYIGWMSML